MLQGERFVFQFQCPLRQDHNGAKKIMETAAPVGYRTSPKILRKSAINVTDIKSEALYAERNLSGLEKIIIVMQHA